MASAPPLTLEFRVPLLVRAIEPLPMFPVPAMVLSLIRIGVVPVPTIKFGPPLPSTTVPVPAKVTAPLTSIKVLLPVLFSVIVPLLVMVPVSVVAVLLVIVMPPDVVRLVNELLLLVIVPVPTADSVPPVMLVLFRMSADPVPGVMARVGGFGHAPPVSSSVPPLVASITLLLVEAALGFSNSVLPFPLALMVELLANTICVLPIVP